VKNFHGQQLLPLSALLARMDMLSIQTPSVVRNVKSLDALAAVLRPLPQLATYVRREKHSIRTEIVNIL